MGLAKSILKTPKKTSSSEKDTGVQNMNIDELVTVQDEVDETINPPSFHQKSKSSKKDHAPQTPKRTYSSDDEAQFLVGDTAVTVWQG